MFEKLIWKLFKMNRNDFNKADKKIEKILLEVYEKGKKDGKKEMSKLMSILVKKTIL
jgi:predicted patatin/cPLA2 family phospholipase